MGQLLHQQHGELLINMLIINIFNKHDLTWGPDSKLGEVMTKLNRQDPVAYVQAVQKLQEWASHSNAYKGHLTRVLNDLSSSRSMNMIRIYPGPTQNDDDQDILQLPSVASFHFMSDKSKNNEGQARLEEYDIYRPF